MISGVPQGFTFGALVFLVYLNDLPVAVVATSVYGYAEDFKVIVQSLHEAEACGSKLENCSGKTTVIFGSFPCYIVFVASVGTSFCWQNECVSQFHPTI